MFSGTASINQDGAVVWNGNPVLHGEGRVVRDVARHAARAYARESEFTEEEALARILDMFEAEIARPTDMGSTTPRSQQGH